MGRRLVIEAAPGIVATDPAAAALALADVAEADGADRELWKAQAARALGASRASVNVRADPRFRVVEAATNRADAVLRDVMGHALDELEELLQQSRS